MPDRHDAVDRILEQWATTRPDVDVSPVAVIGRVSRLSRLVDRRLNANFARFDLEDWMYDVLATLRRSGPPYSLTAGELGQQSMVTSGAITNRIDRLAARGLVERVPGRDRRRVLVQLTDAGRRTVDDVIGAHLAVEQDILAGLSAAERAHLAGLLRDVLLHLGDHAPDTADASAGAPP